MKAYEALSSWATMVTRVSWFEGADPVLTGPSQLETGFRGDPLAHRDDATADESADGRGPLLASTRLRVLRDQLLLAHARQLQSRLIEVHGSHLLSGQSSSSPLSSSSTSSSRERPV